MWDWGNWGIGLLFMAIPAAMLGSVVLLTAVFLDAPGWGAEERE
ncbi:MAG: hypothetical protein ACLQVL_12530 [Terriglobia bacterium]